MDSLFEQVRRVSRPPGWVSLLVVVATALSFLLFFEFGVDPIIDAVIEAIYLLLAVAVLFPIRRLEVGVLEVGWQLFILGRLVDFLDELFIEAEPFVEPYLSGLLMVVSLSVGMVGALALIEQRDERIAELQQINDELSLKDELIDEAPIGITVADMTRQNEPLFLVNDAFTELTGYDKSETFGRNCRFLQGEDTDQEAIDAMREAIDANESVQVTLRNYRKNGSLFWNEITLAPLAGPTGPGHYYVGFQQDATERKQYEQQLEEQRDDLDLLNQMIQHDIRNDLQLVVAYLDLLEGHVEADGREHLETITEAASDAIEITETARDLSETILQEDEDRELVSLADSIRREVTDVRDTFEAATVDVEASLPDVRVEADDMLDSVFRNILTNAIQHNDAETPKVTVSTARTDDSVEVRIADNGPGIPDERKSAVFGRGQKGLESAGTGIGTYLVEKLVTRYGGDVWVEDNDPRGAVFVVRLPVAEEA